MALRFVLLCVCLIVSSLVALTVTQQTTDSNCIGKNISYKNNGSARSVKCQETGESYYLNLETVKKIEDSKPAVDLHEAAKHQSQVLESLWPNIPILPIAYASSSSLPDGPCKRQVRRYLRDLQNETLWAMKMYDASTKSPYGIISGHTRFLGDFDLCYNLEATLPIYDSDDPLAEEEMSGRYCLVDIKYEKQGLPPVDPLERHELEFDPQGSVWEAIREKGDFRRVRRYLLQLALCVPEVCTAADIETALKEPFAQAGLKHNIHYNVSVEPHFCQARKDAPKFSLGAKIYCWALASLFLLIAFSTWYDYSLEKLKEKNGSLASDLVLCFSVRRNFNSLMDVTSGHPGLQTVHLTRFFYMTLVMIGHRLMEYYAAPAINALYLERLYTFKMLMVIFGGTQVVEGFFGIGGMLLSYQMLDHLDKTKKMNFLAAIIYRYIRLTPTYALVVLFNILVLPHLGSGPYWEWKVGLERDTCSSNWWANLLYINNYVNPQRICMFQTWYLSTDYHLYILALFVTYAFWRMPRKLGYPFLSLIILGGCVIPFINTYWFGVAPMYRGLLYMQEIRDDPYFYEHYVKTHERLTSYFIGVLAGAVLYDHNRNPWRLNKVVSKILFILLAVLLPFASELTGHKYFDPNSNHSRLEAAIYACLHKGAFAMACCSVAVLITVGQGLTFHFNFLTPRWVQPLGRLTFGAFLVHSLIQLYDVGVTRSSRHISFHQAFWNYVPDVVYAFFLSLLISLAVEGPFRRMEKLFITKKEKSEPVKGVETEAKKTS